MEDLRGRLEEAKSKATKEEKLVDSIQKMRKMLMKADEVCSLKELWRWIKQLPALSKH